MPSAYFLRLHSVPYLRGVPGEGGEGEGGYGGGGHDEALDGDVGGE